MPAKQMKHRPGIGIPFGTAIIKTNWGEIMISDSPQYFILQGGRECKNRKSTIICMSDTLLCTIPNYLHNVIQ